MSTTRDQVDSQVESMKNELQQLRDEIRVRMHLASMELRDRFEKIEPDVKAFEHRAEQVSEDVGEELHEGWNHLKKALTRIRDELEKS